MIGAGPSFWQFSYAFDIPYNTFLVSELTSDGRADFSS